MRLAKVWPADKASREAADGVVFVVVFAFETAFLAVSNSEATGYGCSPVAVTHKHTDRWKERTTTTTASKLGRTADSDGEASAETTKGESNTTSERSTLGHTYKLSIHSLHHPPAVQFFGAQQVRLWTFVCVVFHCGGHTLANTQIGGQTDERKLNYSSPDNSNMSSYSPSHNDLYGIPQLLLLLLHLLPRCINSTSGQS